MAISALGNQIRLSGLISGMDTDQMVKDLMRVQQMKYTKMYQSKTLAEWKKDAYTEINNALRKFKDEYASFLSSKNNMMSSAAYKAFSVEMASNASLSVTATANAREGSYSVEVLQLARGATMTGEKATSGTNGLSASEVNNTAIENLKALKNGTVSGEIQFTINGKDFTFQSTDSLKTIMDTVNSSGAGVTMSYSQITDKFTIETKTTGAYDPSITEPADPGAFNFVYDGAYELPPLMEEPGDGATQAELDAYEEYLTAVKAYQDDYQEKHTAAQKEYITVYSQYQKELQAYRTNEARKLTVDDTSGFLHAVGLTEDAKNNITAARSAELKINGTDIVRESNSFEIDGITLKLTKETTEPISFTVKRDTQQTIDLVKNFVSAYNNLMDSLYGKLTEKKNYGYSPLTTEQRNELTESEAKQWDEKAMSGLLKSDSTLRTLVDSLQSAFSSAVGGYGTLSSIGITGSAYKYQSASHLEVDEEKLRAALETDADKVFKMFTNRVEDEKGNVVKAQSGFITRMTDALDRFTSTTQNVNLKTLTDTISDWEKKMTAENARLYKLQESYYKKFTAMETALAKMQSQSNALAGFGYSS